MKYVIIIFLFLLINNCSLDKDSRFWTEDIKKKDINNKILLKIIEKSEEITTMSLEEYNIYIDDYTKKSKYPNIN